VLNAHCEGVNIMVRCHSCKKCFKIDSVKMWESTYTKSDGKQVLVKRELCPRCYVKQEVLEKLELLSNASKS
jgi:hypothetical protein